MTDQQQQQQHPTITPPFELKQRWLEQAARYPAGGVGRAHWLIDHAAQWGYDQRGEVNEAKLQQARDQQLTECIQWLAEAGYAGPTICMRAALRPKPPSLAEPALEALRSTPCTEQRHYDALFAALNRLKQLEDSND
jgi:hypothetical protein